MKELIFLFLFYPFVLSSENHPNILQHDDSLSVVLQSKDGSEKIPVLLTLCWDLRNAEPEKSIKYGTEAINLASQYKDYESLAKAYSFVGVAYRVMGRYSESIDLYYKGLEVAQSHNIPDQAGFAHLNLANLYIYQEHANLAFENIKKAEDIAIKTNNKSMLAYVYLFYGRTYSIEGKLDTALLSYEKSLSLRKEINQAPDQASCYKYIGDIHFQKGDYDAAMENYNMSLEKVDKKGDKNLYTSILTKKSLILAQQMKLNEAKKLAYESLTIAKDIKANMAVKDALAALVTISLKSLDYKSATEYQQKVIQYSDSLFSQKLTEKIFLLEYQMEKQQRNARIDLLNKDNAIKTLKIKRIKIISIALTSILTLLATFIVILLVLFRQRRKHAKLLELQNQEIIEHRNNIELQNLKLTETNEQLERSEEELRRIVQTKDKLFSIIAHDLRSPFMSLAGLTEVMYCKALTMEKAEIAEFSKMINNSSHKLLNLIENLLQWSKSQTGTLKLFPGSLHVKEITDEAMKIYQTQAETKGITLANEVPDDICVYADRETFSTVLRNFIHNGIKYTEKGGVVTVSARPENEKVTISVSDNGIGMSQEALKKLFKIEESYTTIGTGNEAGTGLGLIICKEFAEINKGTITVESTLGKGTAFYFILPSGENKS
jgi:signal transduction histidine kinase